MQKRFFLSFLMFLLAVPTFAYAESDEEGNVINTEDNNNQHLEDDQYIDDNQDQDNVEENEPALSEKQSTPLQEEELELTADEWYEKAMSETSASNRVGLFSEAYHAYPDNQKIINGYNSSVRNLLDWASRKHNEGDYTTALNRYDYIISLSGIQDSYISEAQWKKSFALKETSYPEAETVYNQAMAETTASGRFDAFSTAVKLFPNNEKIRKGFIASAENLFNYALNRHVIGDFEKAIDRYEHILKTDGIEESLAAKTQSRLNEAQQNKLPSDEIYQAAINESSASKKLQLFIQGYEEYPEDKRFSDGIESSALGLLKWARSQHQKRDFNTATDRYNVILDAPVVSDLIKDSAKLHLDYASKRQLIPTIDWLKKEYQSQTKVSSIFEQSKTNLLFYPELSEFANELNASSMQLLSWAKNQHDKGEFSIAVERYNMILATPYLNGEILIETSSLKENALNHQRTADAIYNEAINEGRASYKLSLFVEGYNFYPEDKRFVNGINSSVAALLDWAIIQHNNGDYQIAIDRYEMILSTPMVSTNLLNQTAIKLEDAKIGKRPADIIYNQIQKETTASALFDLNSEGYHFYPEDVRFQKGLKSSSETLFNLAFKYHGQSRYDDAVSRYEKLIDTNGVPSLYKTKASILLKYANTNSSIPSIDDYHHFVESESTVSGKLNTAIEGYWIYEGDSRIVSLVIESARALLDWATTKHQNGEFDVALQRYNVILNLPVKDSNLFAEAEVKLEYAKKNETLPTPETILQEAKVESSASRKLDHYIKGYILYPSDNRFLLGIEESSQSLLIWASRQQENGDFKTAIDRYEKIISSPGVPKEIVLDAQLRKGYAVKNLKVPTANELYNLAKSNSTVSGKFQYNLEGYVFYPDDSRFVDGMVTSSNDLFDYATKLHRNKDYSGAISRYEILISSPGVPKYIVESAAINLEYAEVNKMPPRELIQYTYYDLSLSDALRMQMNASPQTDKYRNSPAYVSSSYLDIFEGGVITGNSVNLRTSTSLKNSENVRISVGNGTTFIVLDSNVSGDTFSGSTRWYKIEYKGEILYVHSSLAGINSKVGRAKQNVNVHADTNSNSHVYGTITKGSLVTILSEGNNWHQVSYGTWRNATANDVLEYLDPNNFLYDEKEIFQFVDLSKPSGVTATVLNDYLRGKGDFDGQGQAFIDAGVINGVNDLYLVSHAMLETGFGTSSLARGLKYNGVTVYNFFGIEAYDSCPVECGAKKAYIEGWTTPYKAIVGGAKFIGESYIKGNNKANTVQNTLYKMRWNPEFMDKNSYAYHQYATDVGWASKQINTMYNLYKEVGYYVLNLDIPIYR
ncbi:N-acetylglucosaminidase [Ornithinibacillus sp. FSL M8-0202]|uniref:N-acetylglucosaminidase n=1 Tax=Ornithinibacillus sp. FSL M8-0202 TaxID=2921616 RepID=UPI0030D5B09C